MWFDFAALCDGPRSQRDYLELARRFAVMLVSGVPRLGPDQADAARRFTWLVDILYDHRVKLVASAAVPAESLYLEGPHAGEFYRTVSRLIEMRTRDYMALPHVASALLMMLPRESDLPLAAGGLLLLTAFGSGRPTCLIAISVAGRVVRRSRISGVIRKRVSSSTA